MIGEIDKSDPDMAMTLVRLGRKVTEADISADENARKEVERLELAVGQMVKMRIRDGSVQGMYDTGHTLSSYMSGLHGKSLGWKSPEIHAKLSEYLGMLNDRLRLGNK